MSVVWSLAGHDPLAAAGFQADLRVATSLNVTLRTLMASFTAQNHQAMLLCKPVPEEWLAAQWQALAAIETPSVIKLGLIANVQTLQHIRDLLLTCPETLVVCDPILASSAGYTVLGSEGLQAYRELLFPRINLFTPNRPEAEQFLGRPLTNEADIMEAARDLRAQGIAAVLIKGGHSEGEEVFDYFDDGERAFWLASDRKPGSFRGTGCALSAAIACELAKKSSLREAVVRGHAALQAALKDGQGHEKRILSFAPPQHAALGRLSYQCYFPKQAFPAIDDGPIGFYPVVPDLDWVKRLLPTGIHTIQLRLKDKSRAELTRAIAEANALCRRADVRLFINDHWKIACNEGAYGVHLGQEDLDTLTPEDLDWMRASGLRLGVSTHSYEEAARALSLRPSYVALGPIFETTCKSMNFGPQGMSRVREWQELCPDVPLVAIGGLKLEHGPSILAHGAHGIAVVSDVIAHPQPEQRTRQWLKLWQDAWQAPKFFGSSVVRT